MFYFDIVTVIQIVILVLILFGGLEYILRKKGREPRTTDKERFNIVSDNKYYHEHPMLGFALQKGTYILNIDNRFTFTATHEEKGRRITGDHSKFENIQQKKPEIWIFGCSYTYGWLVQDNEAYPWLLQEMSTEYKFVNFAVSAYGTLQSYMQFKEALTNNEAPKKVILGYCGFHAQRNTFTRSWKKELTQTERFSRPFKVPYARLKKDNELVIKHGKIKYTGLPFNNRLALVNYVENKANQYHEKIIKTDKVTEVIMSMFYELCEKNGCDFIVLGINKASKKMLRICEKKGISTLDISVERGSIHPEHSFYPFDSHPSALAHKKYADKITKYLKK